MENQSYPLALWMPVRRLTDGSVAFVFGSDTAGNQGNGWTVVALLVTALVVGVGIVFSRRRSRRRITQLESELRHAHVRLTELESRITSTLEALPLGLVQADADRKICQVNPAFSKIFGYEPSEAIGKTTEFLYADPEQFRAQGKLRFNRSAEPSDVPYEVAYRRKDGSEFLSETVAGVFRDAKGSVNGMLGLVADVSAKKLVERALRMNQYSVDHASDAIYWFRRDASMMYANEQALQKLGYSRTELMQLNAGDLDAGLTSEAWETLWERSSDAETHVMESRHRRKDGSDYECEVSLMVLDFEGEEFVTAHVRDITERKESQAILRLSHFSTDASQSLIFWIQPNGVLKYVNEATCRLLAYDSDDLLRKRMDELDLGISKEQWEERWTEMRSKGYEAVETELVDSTGEKHWIELQLNHFEFEDQQLLVAIGQCISERKKAEAETEAAIRRAEESERRFRDLADSASPLSWTTNKDSGCSWLNKRWLQYCGRPMGSSVCKTAW